MKTVKSTAVLNVLRLAALASAVLATATTVAAHTNPVDSVSNPQKLEYQDVEARRPDFAPPFLRDGVVNDPYLIKQIVAGTTLEQVVTAVGQPLKKSSGKSGTEWDYNLKFLLPASENYMVCQYKLVMDDGKQVVEQAVWRRSQCKDIVDSASAKR